MGISKKSQKQKRTDKETQSPMIKVFKDMIQREKNDPEKTILIKKEKQENRKKKTYSGINQKCNIRSCDSSSTERLKTTRDSKMAQDLQQQIYDSQNQDLSGLPYSSEKKESWWFWKDVRKKKRQTDDTCSCVSCAFKKLVGSDYACIACLMLVFSLTVAVGFFVVYRGVTPVDVPQVHDATDTAAQSEALKARRQFRSDGTGVDRSDREERNHWKDFVTDPWKSLSVLSGTEFGDSNLRDANYIEESVTGIVESSSQILETEKLVDTQTSEKLRDFYKRLIQTDARIRKLKTKSEMSNAFNTVDDVINANSLPDRYKRSLMSVNNLGHYDSQKKRSNPENKIDLSKFNIFYPPFVAVRNENDKSRIKRTNEKIFDREPSGIIIEKKKVMFQYAPIERKRNFPKWEHSIAPNQFKSHERQLKHPYYKNSQRLDELLDQILDKKIDKVIANPFTLDFLIGDRDKCKHNKQDRKDMRLMDYDMQNSFTLNPTRAKDDVIRFTSPKNIDVNLDSEPEDAFKLTETKRDNLKSDFKSSLVDKGEMLGGKDEESNKLPFQSSTPRYDILLSVSTLMLQAQSDVDIAQENVKRIPNSSRNSLTSTVADLNMKKRKLLQINEEDDENLGYEDFKEVLADYTDSHDETDKQVQRDKRSEALSPIKAKKFNKFNIPSTYNLNWKGPMRLYPDELNVIMKQTALQNSKIDLPAPHKEMSLLKEEFEISDTEYVEDYLNNKYAKLAQAYSDYGVLNTKKEYVTNAKSTVVTESSIPEHKLIHGETLRENEKNMKYYISRKRRNVNMPSLQHEITTSSKLVNSLDDFKISKIKPKDDFNLTDSKFILVSNESKKQTDNQIVSQKKPIQVPTYGKRSLKSINVEELKEPMTNKMQKDLIIKNNTNITNEVKQEVVGGTNIRNNTLEGFTDILNTLSDWFLTLAKFSGELGYNSTSPENKEAIKATFPTLKLENVTKDIMYPMYDADMIDNIGHRSRALLAIEENTSGTPSLAINITAPNKKMQSKGSIRTGPPKKISTTSKTITTAGQPKVNVSGSVNKTSSGLKAEANKTVIKRSADNNLIFWNDIYDDEYGVKIDYFDNEQRSKHSINNENFVKRSGQWINRKFRKLGEHFRTGSNSKKTTNSTNRRPLRSIDDFRPGYHVHKDHSQHFGKKMAEEDKENDKAFDFATLTANMKQICREAVQAVQKTRTLNVRQDQNGEAEATSLMQQLVKLMTDLVDFQVQQKTCAKLPPDLEKFLHWLTSPNSDDSKDGKFYAVKAEPTSDYNRFSGPNLANDGMPVLNMPFSREGRDDPKAELVNTLQAVQDLLRQYETMNDEEKNKLMGVKQYLEQQVGFLTKELSAYDYNISPLLPKFFRKRGLPSRRKRHMKPELGRAQTLKNPPFERPVNKYVKLTGIKKTRTTSSYFDSTVTDSLRKRKHKGVGMVPSGKPKTTSITNEAKNLSSNVKS